MKTTFFSSNAKISWKNEYKIQFGNLGLSLFWILSFLMIFFIGFSNPSKYKFFLMFSFLLGIPAIFHLIFFPIMIISIIKYLLDYYHPVIKEIKGKIMFKKDNATRRTINRFEIILDQDSHPLIIDKTAYDYLHQDDRVVLYYYSNTRVVTEWQVISK